MISRILRKLMNAELYGIGLMAVAVLVLTYGVSKSLENTDTNYFLQICLVALLIGLGLGKTRLNGIQSSVGIAALGLLIVWILGARLSQPLLVFGREVLSVTPEIIPAIRYKESSLLVFPMTMISKRVEDGEPFDVAELFDGLAKQLAELIQEGIYGE
jgi:hypothetical protein